MGKLLLTHSRSASFKKCRKRHWWEYEIGLRPTTDAKALRMGSAGHDGLDALKQGGDLEAAIAVVRGHYTEPPVNFEVDDWNMERTTVEALVSGYEWRWRAYNMEIVESEKAFQLPLINPETGAGSTVWNLAGKIDGIVRLEDGRLAVLEHKFISESLDLDGDYWRRLQLDPQVSLYVYAARQLGFDVATVLYDLVRKPSIRPSIIPVLDDDGKKIVVDEMGERVFLAPKKKADIEAGVPGPPRQTADKKLGYELLHRDMMPQEWEAKLLHDIGERPGWYYARNEIARLDADINELLTEMWDLQQTIRAAQAQGRWYRTVSRDSCPYCPFFGLCSSKYDPSQGEVPEGFERVENVHPELTLEIEDAESTVTATI